MRCGLTAISTRNPTGNQPALGSHKGFQGILGWTMKKIAQYFSFSAFLIMKYYEVPSTSYKGKPPRWTKSTFHCTLGVVVVEMEGINSCPDFSNWLENVTCMKLFKFQPMRCVVLCMEEFQLTKRVEIHCVFSRSNRPFRKRSKAQKDFSTGGIPSLSPGWLDVWNLKLNYLELSKQHFYHFDTYGETRPK